MKLAIAIGIALSLTSCAFSAVKRPDLTNVNKPLIGSFNLSKAQAIDNAIATLTILGYTPVIDSDGSIVTNLVATAVPANCNCGTWNGKLVTGTADTQFKIYFAGQQSVRMDLKFSCAVTFTATNLYGVPTRSERYYCASKGIMEQKFLRKFNEYAPAQDTYSLLEKLAKLKNSGAITDEEFKSEKKKLLEIQ